MDHDIFFLSRFVESVAGKKKKVPLGKKAVLLGSLQKDL